MPNSTRQANERGKNKTQNANSWHSGKAECWQHPSSYETLRNLTAPKNRTSTAALTSHWEDKTLPQHILWQIRHAKLQMLHSFCAQGRKLPFSIMKHTASAEMSMHFINMQKLILTTVYKVANYYQSPPFTDTFHFCNTTISVKPITDTAKHRYCLKAQELYLVVAYSDRSQCWVKSFNPPSLYREAHNSSMEFSKQK